MLVYGLPIYSSLLLAGVLLRYRQMVLAWYTTDEGLGNYYVAMNFNNFMTVVTSPISTMLLPSFSKLEKSDELRGFLRYSVKYILFVVVPLSFLVSAVSRDLVRIFYGPEFSLAPSYLAIYILTYSYSVFTLVLGNFFKGTGRVKTFLKATAVGFAAALPLTLALVSMWKVVGLAVSIFISDVITLAYLYREARGKLGISIGVGDPIRIFSAAAFSFAVTFLFGMKFQIALTILSLIVNGVIFVLMYMVASALMGVLRREDLTNLRLAFKGTPFTPIINGLLALYEGITYYLGILG
jgi:O-antigen/teichoic acid export membrane protein